MNIGISRKRDQIWTKQFNSLFIILNENNEVVAWQLTKKEQFDVVKDLLESLKIRLRSLGASLQTLLLTTVVNGKINLKVYLEMTYL